MLWLINDIFNLRKVISLLRHPKPIYIPLIIARATLGSTSTDTLIEKINLTLEKLQKSVERQKLKRKLVHDRKRPWSVIKTRNPLRTYCEAEEEERTFKDYFSFALKVIDEYEVKYGPLFPKKKRGRRREFDYKKLFAAIIAGKRFGKSLKEIVDSLKTAQIKVTLPEITEKYPKKAELRYILKIVPETALSRMLQITDAWATHIAKHLFDWCTDMFIVDGSDLETRIKDFDEIKGRLQYRQKTYTVTLVTRYITNTVPMVIRMAPQVVVKDIIKVVKARYIIADKGYRNIVNIWDAIRNNVVFLTPYVIDRLEGAVKELAEFLYKLRKPGERPFGNFSTRMTRLSSMDPDMCYKELLAYLTAHNIRSYFRVALLNRLVTPIGPRFKREALQKAHECLMLAIREAYKL